MLEAFLAAVGVVFLAELGDKSQLLTLTLATRYRPLPVLAGVTLATAVLMGLSVVVGAVAGDALPDRPVEIAAGLVFLGFAVWTFLDRDDEEPDDAAVGVVRRGVGRSAVLTVAAAFALAELGDKTMLTAITLASTRHAVGVWAGATVGEVAANVVALAVGGRLARVVPERVLHAGAAALFAIFGLLLLLGIG